ncbi:putative Mg2+ transporter [Diaporthe sp. PMI_573]|nr:putative Mg2+ transporter [Diaporthaceae sp. PMI_573]
MPAERGFIRSWHASTRGSGYTQSDSSTVYSFSPTRASRATSSSRTAQTDEEEAEKSENGSASQESGASRVRATYVFQSRYTGESRLGDPHTVKLSVQRTTAVKQKHLFRWIHTTRSSMMFDEFANIASQVPALDATERKAIAQLLPRVRRKVKTIQTSTGKNVQYMEPAVIPHKISDNGKNRSIVSRTAAWVCLPYLSLENYSGLLSAESSAEFPIQTLLQAQYSKTARERDMQQAVCQIDRRGNGRCFHIAQLWCLIINKSLLLTYGRMTEDALCAVSRDAMTEITIENIATQAKPRLIVSYRGSVAWGFSLEECQTWTDFLSHFREFWPRPLVFFMQRRQLNAEDWPRIWHGAQRVSINLAIDIDIGQDPKPPPRRLEELIHDTHTSDTENTTKEQQAGVKSNVEQTKKPPDRTPIISKWTHSTPRLGSISIFKFLEGVSHPGGVDESVLNEHVLEVEHFLLSHTNFTDRKAYRNCHTSSRNHVHAMLETRGSTLSQAQSISSADQLDYEEDVDIFNTADIIFRFFFPADAEVATVGKFWGAVKFLIGVSSQREGSALPRKIRRQRSVISRITRNLAVTITSFNETIGYSADSSQLDIIVPDELKNAWLHLTMGFIFVPHDEVMSETLLVQAQLLIEESIENIVKSLSTNSLTENAVILPIELFTLMGLKLLQDSTAGLPDISQTYSAYLESVAADIANKPSDRIHERNIGLLKQELSIIVKTFDAQCRVLESLQREFKPQVMGKEYLSSTVNPNTWPDYTRGWHEPSRARSSYGNPDVPVRPTHHMEYPRQYAGARPMYQDNDISNRTVYDRDSRTHAGWYDDDHHVSYGTSQSNPDFKLAPTDVGGYRKLFTEECFRHIERRMREFGEFRYQATLLEEENQNKVETTRDRQERAIYAFTIVTVIFLPLSSVASIFGINTKDVRDTDLDQWAYWATAVPVTAAVVFFGLLWTGELGNILRWVSSFGSHVSKGHYQRIPDEYYDGDPLLDRLARGDRVAWRRGREPLGGYTSRFPSPPPTEPPSAAFVRRRGTVYER